MQKDCTNAELLRAVLPCQTLKRVARLFALPIDTARAWIYRDGVPQKKLTIFYERLREENERELERRMQIRRQLEELANARNYQATVGDSLPDDALGLAKTITRRA